MNYFDGTYFTNQLKLRDLTGLKLYFVDAIDHIYWKYLKSEDEIDIRQRTLEDTQIILNVINDLTFGRKNLKRMKPLLYIEKHVPEELELSVDGILHQYNLDLQEWRDYICSLGESYMDEWSNEKLEETISKQIIEDVIAVMDGIEAFG